MFSLDSTSDRDCDGHCMARVTKMDLSALESQEFNDFITRCEIEASKANTDRNLVSIRAFVGGERGEQSLALDEAIKRLCIKYHRLGITIIFEAFTNDIVRTKLRWSATELFNNLLAADIHIVPTHCHRGMPGDFATCSRGRGVGSPGHATDCDIFGLNSVCGI